MSHAPNMHPTTTDRSENQGGSGALALATVSAFEKYRLRVTRLTIVPDGEPIFSEQATHVEIEDEAAGEFVKVTQQPGHTADAEMRSIRIDPTEWPAIRHAIEQLLPNQ